MREPCRPIVHRLVCFVELDLALILVSHLRRPSGDQGHEGGAKVSLAQLRSSHSIAQLSDGCIGLEVMPRIQRQVSETLLS